MWKQFLISADESREQLENKKASLLLCLTTLQQKFHDGKNIKEDFDEIITIPKRILSARGPVVPYTGTLQMIFTANFELVTDEGDCNYQPLIKFN